MSFKIEVKAIFFPVTKAIHPTNVPCLSYHSSTASILKISGTKSIWAVLLVLAYNGNISYTTKVKPSSDISTSLPSPLSYLISNDHFKVLSQLMVISDGFNACIGSLIIQLCVCSNGPTYTVYIVVHCDCGLGFYLIICVPLAPYL